MPSSHKLKPLAVGTCIGDLNKHAGSVKISISSDLQCRQYCTSFNGVFKKAEAKYQDGDEENAYILFMRLLYIFEGIKKTFEYQKQKKVYNDIINTNNVKKAMERAESLSKSLEARYKQLELDRKSFKPAKVKPNPSEEDGNEKNKDLSKRLPPHSAASTPKEKGRANEANGNVIKSLPDVPLSDNEKDGGSSSNMEQNLDPWIDSNELYHLLKSGNTKPILVIDTRPPDEFLASRIKNNSISLINVKEELLKPGANVNSIERRLSNDVWNYWITRGSKEHIIILDHDSTRESITKDSPIQILKDAIYNRSINSKCEPRFLSSGFSGWQLYYPSLCTDPFYRRKKANSTPTVTDASKLLSNLSYPTLNDFKANNQRPQNTPRSVDLPGGDEKTETPKNMQDVSENEGEDMFAKFRRQLDGTPEASSRIESPGSQPHDNGDNTTRENRTEPRGPDVRPKTGSFDTNFLRNVSSEGMTNANKGSGNRLDILKGSEIELKDVPINNFKGSSTGMARLPPDMAGPALKPAEDSADFGSSRRPGQVLNKMREGGMDDVEIITAKYSRGDSEFGSKPSNPSRRLDGNGQDFGALFQAFSDKGNINEPLRPEAKYKDSIGRDGKSVAGGILQNDSPDFAKRIEGQSPASNIPSTGKKPSPVDHQSGSLRPGFGKYATMPRLPGHVQPAASGADNHTSKRPTTNSGPSLPQSDRNGGTEKDGEFSSSTFPRANIKSLSSNLPSPEHLRPRLGAQNNLTLNRTGATSSGSTSYVSSNIPNPDLARPMASSNAPPASLQAQKLNQDPANLKRTTGQHPTGVTGHQGAPKLAHTTRQPQSLPHEQNKPEASRSFTRKENTDSDSNDTSEIATNSGLPYGWEKSIDRTTGRVYFIDHTTKSTHWQLPPDFYASRERDAAIKQKRKAPQPPAAKEAGETASGLKRSLSTPNLADLDADKENSKPVAPIIDRSSKPLQPKTQLVDRSTKPLSKSRLECLSPIYGSKGRNLTGLKNLGNTCYMNSVIQCLSSTVPLACYFNSGEHLKHLNSRSMNRRPEEVAKELAFLIKVLWSGQYRSVSPIDFKSAIGHFASQFANYKQQDAHEFLMFFMDGIHEDTNKIKRRTPMIEQNNDNVPDSISSVKAWKDYAKNNDSVIVDLFQGQLRSTVCCKTCGRKSVTFDVFSCLPLELTSQRACTLDDCIRAFTKPERIGGNDSWKCTGCKAYREATKTIELWKLPPVIIFQLKRFSSDGRWHNKLQAKVDFPITDLDTSRYLVGPGSELSKYNLYSVVNHYGSFESGHYTAYCLNQHSWYCYNDNVVSSIDRGELKSPAAYLLFYTAVDFKAYLK